MNLLFSIPQQPISAWTRAAKEAGINLIPFAPEFALEAFGRHNPDLIVIPNILLPAIEKAIIKYKCPPEKIVRWNQYCEWSYPAADVPGGFTGGEVRPEYICDAAYCGHLHERHVPYLNALWNKGISVRIYGDGERPECVGRIDSNEVAHAYRSARFVLDLDGDPFRILSAWAAGGQPIGTKCFNTTNIFAIRVTPISTDPDKFSNLIHQRLREDGEEEAKFARSVQEHVLANDTYQHRLNKLLNVAHYN